MRVFVGVLGFVGIVAACGGAVQGDPQCGDVSLSCSNGARCIQNVDDCGPRTFSCTCASSQWQCEHVDCVHPTPTPTTCPVGGAHNGDACSIKGMDCQPAEIPKCGDAYPPCTCDGSKFVCQQFKCPPCPDPSTVKDGESCLNAGIYSNCPGFDACGDATTCTCVPSGGNLWHCGGTCTNDGGPIDASGG
jgi:hypothetical protein